MIRAPHLCAALALASLASACSSDRTSILLDVQSASLSTLSRFQLSVGDRNASTAVDSTLTVRIPDAFAGRTLPLELWGMRGEDRFSHGAVVVTPILHDQIDATLVLVQLPCGAWCTEGATSCMGDGTVICEQRDSDQCFEWSAVTACPPDAPFCSLGVCGKTCVDECADGETRCDGPSGVRICGENDSDPCKDWLPFVACADGETCSNGACSKTCRDECTAGAVACFGAGSVACGDLNGDGCLEWGPVVPCGSGMTCSAGVCSSAPCTDECTADTCDGTLHKICGNYDLDSCKELSPGTSCVPVDACIEGMCSANACTTAPKVCLAPPASSCVDGSTLKVYDAAGSCAGGTCNYTSHEVACPNCPACDACAGVTCNMPASVCYGAAGTCSNGSCTYPYANGVTCDDGNACTVNDTCASGVCSGTQKTCTTPPAAICSSPTARRTYAAIGTCSGGACTYAPTDMTCTYGCAAGACKTAPLAWTLQTSSTIQEFYSVWGSGPNDVYAVGMGGVIGHSTGGGVWTYQNQSTSLTFTSVWGTAGSNVFVTGNNGTILHSTGSGAWTAQSPSDTHWILAGWGSSPTDLYVADETTKFFRSTGNGTWTDAGFGPGNGVIDTIWGTNATNIYAGGDSGIIHSTGDGTWTAQSLPTSITRISGIWGSSATDVYAVGDDGIFHSTGNGTWTRQTQPGQWLYSVWGSSASDVYAVGDAGTILHTTGNGTWSAQAAPTMTSLLGVWGSGSLDVYVVGLGGTILHHP